MPVIHSPRKFRRMPERNWLGGICAGFAYFVGIEVWIVRVFWIIFLLLSGGVAILFYMLFLVVPKWENLPTDFDEVTGD